MLPPSEAKNIGLHPTLIALNVDFHEVSLEPMEGSGDFCSLTELFNRGQY